MPRGSSRNSDQVAAGAALTYGLRRPAGKYGPGGLNASAYDRVFLGIQAPDLRASLRATATACLRFVIFFPLPDFSVPSLYSCITLLTLLRPLDRFLVAVRLPYLIDLFETNVFRELSGI